MLKGLIVFPFAHTYNIFIQFKAKEGLEWLSQLGQYKKDFILQAINNKDQDICGDCPERELG